jgi:UDP-2,3-diacylglucosamine pyrophosphatase LpxH
MFEWLVHSQTRQKMLKMFFKDINAPLYGLEIAQTLNASPGTTHRELNAMLEQGVISKKKEGALVMYRLNTQHPYFFELKKTIFPAKKANRVLFVSDLRLSVETSEGVLNDLNLFLDYAEENASELVFLGNTLETLSGNAFQTYLLHKPLFDRISELSHHVKITYVIGDEDYLLRTLSGEGEGKKFFDSKILFSEEYQHSKFGIYATFGQLFDDFSSAKATKINKKSSPNLALLMNALRKVKNDKYQLELAHILDYMQKKGRATLANDSKLLAAAKDIIHEKNYSYVVFGRSSKATFKEVGDGLYFNAGSWTEEKNRQFVEIDKDGAALVSMKDLR